ncbi:MAG: LCP family protein, partial [Oscillospiraceae bacterium]|nr:LCP family protein [Oscillospiraceae bacterium]
PKKRFTFSSKQDESYGDWLYEQGDDEETVMHRQFVEQKEKTPEKQPKTRKKPPFWLIVPALLACLVLAFFVVSRPPAADSTLERKDGFATVLLAGTDAGGYRTDTMMLLSVDRQKKSMSLISIPRDTLIYCSYAVPKINSAYGWAEGGENGMEELMMRVSEIIGFRPDGYLLVDLTVFEQLVDLMGGVSYDVPADMHYDDPSQDLSIHLAAGHQKLDGKKALQLVRFRSGYANADLGRVSVQREFLTAAIDQWSNVLNVFKTPSALRLLRENAETDLTTGNLLWLAESALVCTQGVQTATLPGTPKDIAGGSYYVLDTQTVAQMINTCCNPYEQGVSPADLAIRTG